MSDSGLKSNDDFNSIQVVLELEKKIGVALPSSYRAFLLTGFETKPEKKRFQTEDGKVYSMVSSFFEPSFKGVNLELKKWTLSCKIPSNMLAIAKDPADNLILLSFNGEDFGWIYYWSQDEEPEAFSCSYQYMRKISGNFSEFLATLS